MLAVAQNGLQKLLLHLIDRPHLLGEDEVSEKPLIALSGVRSSWDMLARNWLFSSVARMQLPVLDLKRLFIAPGFIQHLGPVDAHDDLITEGLEQLQLVFAEGLAISLVVRADGSYDDAAGAQRYDRR